MNADIRTIIKREGNLYTPSFYIIFSLLYKMAPPKWLVEYWKQEPNWLKRYMRGSDLNSIMCGINMKDSMWTKKTISEFNNYMNLIKQPLKKDTILYRGTYVVSPTMSPACLSMINCQYMSSSKSLSIAKEFAGKRGGFIHTFLCKKNVITFDLQHIYEKEDPVREKEVLIYPGQQLTLISKKGNMLTWEVTPTL